MNTRRSIALARDAMDTMDLRRQGDILDRSPAQRPFIPSIKTARRDFEQPAHDPYRIGGLVRLHESVEFFVLGAVSWANQAVAFDSISRSSLSWRFSRRSLTSSCRSA